MPDPLRVLLIEDDASYRALTRAALLQSERDAEIVEAVSGEDGARRAIAEPFDAILLDHELPDTDGIAVLRSLQARGVRAPVIAMTGKGSQEIAVQFMKAGASDYLVKGDLTPMRLAQTVRSVVGTRRLASEVERLETALARQERAAIVGALSGTAIEGFHDGVEALAAALEPLWAHVAALPHGTPRRAELLAAQADARAVLAALAEIEDELRVLRRLLSPQASPVPIAFDAEVERTLRLFRRLAPRSIEIQSALGFRGDVAIEPAAARQIVAHLLNNAIEALPDGGTILVQTRRDDGHVTLMVRDSGPGMPPELARRAFDLHVSTKEGHEGIGLTIARQLAQAHGGTIECLRAEKPGATLVVRLPIAP